MCVISQRNHADSFGEVSASACGAAFRASTNANASDPNATISVAPSFTMPSGALAGNTSELDMVRACAAITHEN